MITKLKKEKLRKLYYKFCSNIQYLFLLTLLTALGVVSLKNMKKISRLEHQINFPLTERIKTIEEKEERPTVPTAESKAFSEYARQCAGKTPEEWYKKEYSK